MASPAVHVAGASEENCHNNGSFVNEIPMGLEPKLRKNIIFRVPRKLRKLNEAAYTPDIISIGPFHHGKRELEAMESHKYRYYESFCKRTGKSHDDLKRFIEDNSDEVHDSYAATMESKKKDPKSEEIILIDACFIIELFLRNYESCNEDYILRTAWVKKAIQLDLILLENQLPYFLLKNLYSHSYLEDSKRTSSSSSNTVSSEHKKRSFLWLACCFFKDFCTGSDDNDRAILEEMEKKEAKKTEIKHFTDLVRQFRLPFIDLRRGNVSRENYVYSATELDKAGVTFVVNEKASLAEVKCSNPHLCFCSLRLELAALQLDDATELLFRNMIALEQCLYSDKVYIGSYVVLMSQLIKTEEDADFLVEKKIIKNCSKHQVADLFTELGNEIAYSYFYYATDCSKLNKHHDKWLNRTIAKAKKVYFNDLWKGSSTVVGFFLLLFSISGSVKNIFLS